MTNIIRFVPRADRDAEANLHAFVAFARDELTVFGEDLDWNAWKWPGVATFRKLGHSGRGNSVESVLMLDASFIEFAKAYIRYHQGVAPVKDHQGRATALKALEVALLDATGHACITATTVAVLDAAASQVRQRYGTSAASQRGLELQRLARFLSSQQLVANDLRSWCSPFRAPTALAWRTGAAAAQRHRERMPDEDAIRAIAEIFASDPQDPKDIRTTCFIAMVMCAPSRGSEILNLPVDCEIELKDQKGNPVYEWRFFAGKGYGATTKMVIPEMEPIARTAVARIRQLTAPGRDIAMRILEHPDRFPRHPKCPDVSEDAVLTVQQACDALGLFSSTGEHRAVLRQYGVPKEARDVPTLRKLWAVARRKLPPTWPWVNKDAGVTYANALFCMPKNFLLRSGVPSPITPWMPSLGSFLLDISPRESVQGKSPNQTIFDRYGYKGSDGERLRLTSHQPRHLLNTLFHRNGLNQILIATMSGRVDVSQNRVYNHMTEDELTEKCRKQVGPMPMIVGPDNVSVSVREPVYVTDLNLKERGPIHVTEYGFCLHDFIQAPCQRYRDCLNCDEHACEKRNDVRAERIRARLKEVETDLAAAQKGIDEGYMGADRWYEYHVATTERLRKLVAFYDSPEVRDGAIIRVANPTGFNPLNRAIHSMVARGVDTAELKLLVKVVGDANGKALDVK